MRSYLPSEHFANTVGFSEDITLYGQEFQRLYL